MARITLIVAPLALLVLLAGCGGGDTGGDPGTLPAVTDVVVEEEGVTTPGPYQSTEFEPPVGFTVPDGWRVLEDFDLIQAFRGAGEAQALTFESSEGALEERVQQMHATPELEAEEVQEATVGGREARMFEANPEFAMTIEGSEYYALGQGPLRVWVVDVDGTLVSIFAESSVLRTERREADEIVAGFFNEVDQIVATVEFGSPPSP